MGAHSSCFITAAANLVPDIFKGFTITDEARDELRGELRRCFTAEGNLNEELQKAEARLAKLEGMEKNLQRSVLEEDISIGDFKEHRGHIEAERSKLINTVDSIKQRQR